MSFQAKKRFSIFEMGVMMVVTVLCVTVVSYAVSVPYIFENGTVADADQVNANFDYIQTQLDTRIPRIEARTVSKTTGLSPPSGNSGKVMVTFEDTEMFLSPPTITAIVILRGFWASSPDAMNMGESPHTTVTNVTEDGFELVVRYEEGGQTMESVPVEVNYIAVEAN